MSQQQKKKRSNEQDTHYIKRILIIPFDFLLKTTNIVAEVEIITDIILDSKFLRTENKQQDDKFDNILKLKLKNMNHYCHFE